MAKKERFCSEERALLEAIHDDPRPDDRRLIYADWLDDHGQPEYAEFVRLQLEHGEWRPTALKIASDRELELRRAFGWEWARWRSCGLNEFYYYRGLPLPALGLDRCTPSRLANLIANMNPRYRLVLRIEHGDFLRPGELERIFAHALMRRVAVLWIRPFAQVGTVESLLARLASLPVPSTVERLSINRVQGQPRRLAEELFGTRLIVED
jgi:uncharacterized protein (TIGR02996 family)